MNSFFVLTNSILALIVLSLTVDAAANNYPTTKLNGMVGFAKEGGTTGGWDGERVMINSFADLQKYVGDNIHRVLVINTNIGTPTMTKVNLGSNKSIVGNYARCTLKNIYFRATVKSQNIIFQNLIFQHSPNIKGNDDMQLYLNFGKNYWIDHCSFIGHKWSENDGSLDKLLYIGDTADYVTISNCYFGNHKYGLILGHPQDDGSRQFNGLPRLTLCNSHFENLDVRAPGLMRYGKFHVYSNYINKFNIGFTVSTGAQILSEDNEFEMNPGGAIVNNNPLGTGAYTDKDSLNGGSPLLRVQKVQKSGLNVKYSYKPTPAKNVKSFVMANAGAQSKGLVFGG